MIIESDCLEAMRNMESNTIDCILTDPPYGLKFMGNKWDYQIPSIDVCKEALRVCKPGSMMLAFGGTRTYHRLTCGIEDAGWEVRDCLMFMYGTGFPKSHNKFGLEGYGTALKPAYEPILMCMKPLDGTYAQNAEKWGLGGINIDACRISTDDDLSRMKSGGNEYIYAGGWKKINLPNPIGGRWPANVLFDEEAAAALDFQSGVSKSPTGFSKRKASENNCMSGGNTERTCSNGYNDSGYASRFFYCAKASKRERGEDNNHPTVKPIKVLEYLLTLIKPPGDAVVLDPFMGSGSTLIAAKNLGIRAIGIEISKEYCEIANTRLQHEMV
jgi:DNA modification methylase